MDEKLPLNQSIRVENLTPVGDCLEPRWRGEVQFPGQTQKTPILIIFYQKRWNVCELYCPHEKRLLTTAPITPEGLIQCPRHQNQYPLNTCVGYAVEVFVTEDNNHHEDKTTPHFMLRYFDYDAIASQNLILQEELASLRAANHLRENQIIDNFAQMDGMLKTVEESKAALQRNYEQSESMAILFARLMDSVSEILLVLDKQGNIQRSNSPAEKYFQCHKAALLGINPDTLLCDDSLAVLTDMMTSRTPGNRSLLYEGVNQNPNFEIEVCFAIDYRRTAKDQEKKYQSPPPVMQNHETTRGEPGTNAPPVFLIHGSILYSRHGMEEGCVLVASDISQVKQREKILRERQLIDKAKLLQVTMDNVSHGMAVFNHQEQLQVWNHAFFKILDYPASLKQKGLAFSKLLEYDQSRQETSFSNATQSLLDISTVHRHEYQFQNGRCIEFMVNNLPDEGRVISVQDVTEQKQNEATIRRINESLEQRVAERTLEIKNAYVALEGSLKELQNTQEQLVQSEKLASLGQLVAGIAHEMNTPVGVCLTSVTFLSESTQDVKKSFDEETLTSRKFKDYLESCQSSLDFTVKNLQRAAKLVNSFKQLALDRYKEEIQEFILYQHIQNILSSLDPHLMNNHPKIELSGPNNLRIASYPNVWKQIITSLMMNSLRHAFIDMPFGQGRIQIQIHRKKDQLQFVFIDNGCGMDKKQREKIFDPFYTTSRGRGDLGLGMHIVFNMVSQILKGSISCQSNPGKGTQFLICMPL